MQETGLATQSSDIVFGTKRHCLKPTNALVIGSAITAAGSVWFGRASHSTAGAIGAACLGIAFIAMLMLGADGVIEKLQSWVDARPARVAFAPAGLCGLYVIYASSLGVLDIRRLSIMAVYLSFPFLAFSAFRDSASRTWIEPAVILWIWLPMEFGWIRQILTTSQGADLHYAFAQLLAIDAGIVAFTVWNRTPDIGYRFEWSDAIARAAFANFVWFALIAIPLGLAIDFIHYSFHFSKLVPAPAALAGIFMFTAIPEEFLFRGLIQNYIERTTLKPGWSLVFASLIFGASHLNNGLPQPNYRYCLLATIAGVFYGRAWRKTRRLTSSATTHALVDACWSVFFR